MTQIGVVPKIINICLVVLVACWAPTVLQCYIYISYLMSYVLSPGSYECLTTVQTINRNIQTCTIIQSCRPMNTSPHHTIPAHNRRLYNMLK